MGNHYPQLVPKHFHHPKRKHTDLLSSVTPFPPLQTLATTNCFLPQWVYLFWMFHINGIIQYMTICVWLSFIYINVFRALLFYVSVPHSFVWLNIFYCMVIPHFVYPNGCFSCFHILAIVNNAPMNIHIYVFVWTPVFNSFGYIHFEKLPKCFPQWWHHFTFPPVLYESSFLHILTNLGVFDYSHPSGYEVKPLPMPFFLV